MSIFIDTSGFIAVLNKDDVSHTKAAKTWMYILTSEEDLVTTNYVLVETCALVQNWLGMTAIRVFQKDIVPVLRIEWIDKAVHHTAMGIMLAAVRKKLSLVDCVSFETMRLLGITTAFTLDKHFKEQGFACLPA
ncbi:MAG: VapC toxin family PIN domain ribonuclease [Syntrophus sp. (in: bacteria)]|nr:VapC toxin family PIN domain ribonuclease [Syntrophus sp. (in: bacteria)]